MTFAVPRFLAAAAAALTLAAVGVWPLIGYGWHDSAGLLCLAAVFAWVSHDTARMARRRAAADRELRHSTRAFVWPDISKSEIRG